MSQSQSPSQSQSARRGPLPPPHPPSRSSTTPAPPGGRSIRVPPPPGKGGARGVSTHEGEPAPRQMWGARRGSGRGAVRTSAEWETSQAGTLTRACPEADVIGRCSSYKSGPYQGAPPVVQTSSASMATVRSAERGIAHRRM
eukprot:1180773-Prorocentrum_minimum.AAC.1